MTTETMEAAPIAGMLDAQALSGLIAALGAATAAMTAMAEAVMAQAVAINALADAIAAPVDEPEQDNRPRYMDGTLIEDG